MITRDAFNQRLIKMTSILSQMFGKTKIKTKTKTKTKPNANRNINLNQQKGK